jgi:hypothetical protein
MFKSFATLTILSMTLLLSTFGVTSEVKGRGQSNPPNVRQLQKAIGEVGGWKTNASSRIIILQGGGNCTCELRDPETGRCLLYVCGGEGRATWGPIRVPRPASKEK